MYTNAKLFVFPSLYEGFGFPPLESLVCGTEVLCSKASPVPEICENFVTYFNAQDSEELSKKILEKYNSNYTYDSETIIKKITQKYNWQNSS